MVLLDIGTALVQAMLEQDFLAFIGAITAGFDAAIHMAIEIVEHWELSSELLHNLYSIHTQETVISSSRKGGYCTSLLLFTVILLNYPHGKDTRSLGA